MRLAMWYNNAKRHYVEVLEDNEISTPEKLIGQASSGYGSSKVQSLEDWIEENFNCNILNADLIVSSKLRYKMVKSTELLPSPNSSKDVYSIILIKSF